MKITQKHNKLRKRVQKVAWLYKTMKLSIIVMGNSKRLSTDYRPTVDRLSTAISTECRPAIAAISTDKSLDTTYSKQDLTDLSEINFLVLSCQYPQFIRVGSCSATGKWGANCRIISSIPNVSHAS